eukprot:CAMPEP_0172592658 /NCGR_PEP_ID=MMETSP1068-20121228/11688_1 /TAXON_ID=35684 /ORGANISM="Pseudopedinella elastica, Strain CCMP716" /LENGTH=73 /DNA_ID=CAMNT_0013389759 /DNA_START=1 /DNA_END=219 /DNA_ORIENTATION=-
MAAPAPDPFSSSVDSGASADPFGTSEATNPFDASSSQSFAGSSQSMAAPAPDPFSSSVDSGASADPFGTSEAT